MFPGNMALDTFTETEDFPDECDFMYKTKIIHLETNVAKSPQIPSLSHQLFCHHEPLAKLERQP